MKLGRFRILARLGEGGMADVHRALDEASGKEVALKVLKEELARRPEVLRRFVREAEILQELDHPQIVRVLAVGPPEPPAWFAMELLPGGGLAHELENEEPLDDARTVMVVRDVLSALEHAHAKGIVHRDLKPENVLLDEAGRARLTDFGVAKVLDGTQLTHTGTQLGTPQYMAPEQVRGRRSMGPGVDVYATGILLYELLTGRPPFRGQDPVAVGYAHNFEPVPALRRRGRPVPEDLARVCLKALEKKPQGRWRSARSMREALEKVARRLEIPLPALPRAPGPPGRARTRTQTPSRPGVPEPGSRHDRPTERLQKGLIRLMVGLLLVGALPVLVPSTRPGSSAASKEARTRARTRFLEAVDALSRKDWGGADRLFREAGSLDPSLLPSIRDQATASLQSALAEEDSGRGRTFLGLLRWSDPGWPRGLAFARAIRDLEERGKAP